MLNISIFSLTFPLLYRIHEATLDFIEDHDAKDEEHYHEGETIAKGEPREVALTQGDILKGLNDRTHWIGHNQGTKRTRRHHTDGIDYRCGIHP